MIDNISARVAKQIGSKEKYITHVTATLETSPTIAVSLANHSCEVYKLGDDSADIFQLTSLSLSSGLDANNRTIIIDIKFNIDDNNLLYIGSSDGTVKLWDLRASPLTNKAALAVEKTIEFKDPTATTIDNNKTFNCFDVSPNNRLLAVGTDLFDGDAFVLFWDIRMCQRPQKRDDFLGGYWESHTDDITQIKFHPNDSNRLISGATDGLINVYDLMESCEDDALIDTLNTESSVDKLVWLKFDECAANNTNVLGSVTHTSDVQFWKLDDCNPYLNFTRSDIGREILDVKEKCEELEDCPCVYIADLHRDRNNMFILAGLNDKTDGRCLRAIDVTDDGNLKPTFNFIDNTQIVLSSWFNRNTKLLLTGGEQGVLNCWNLDSNKF